ncbi:MAG: hypothetical protein RR086_01990 [Clostridia bacterium]
MRFSAGETATRTGSYRVFDKTGKCVNTVSVKKGQTLPPTQQSGWYYEIE